MTKDEMKERQRILITETCNVIGCRDCGYKNDDEGQCASTDLQHRIDTYEEP